MPCTDVTDAETALPASPPPCSGPGRMASLALLVAPLLAAAAVHGSILGDFFAHDDYQHLYNAANESLARFSLRTHGGHALVAFRTAFYLMWQVFGLEARGWFAVVLLTHLFNTWLLGAILRRLTGEPVIAAAGALLWGISPVSRGSLSWLSVYSHVLVVPFIGLVLYDLARIRSGERGVTRAGFVKWNALLLGASNSFGIGTGMALAAPLWGFVLLWKHPSRGRVARGLLPVLLLVPLAFLGIHEVDRRLLGAPRLPVSGAIFEPSFLLGTLRVQWSLFAYGLASSLGGGLIATLDAPAAGGTGAVFAGPLAGMAPDSVLVLSHWTAVAILTSLALLLWRRGASRRGVVVGSLLAALCGYAAVALGRAVFVIVMGLSEAWLTLQPRYQYAPAFALWIALAVAAGALASGPTWRRRALAAALLVWVAVQLAVAIPSVRAFDRSHAAAGRKRFDGVVAQILQQIRKTPPGALAVLPNQPVRFSLAGPWDSFPGWAAVFVIAFEDDVVEGRTVRFRVEDEKLLHALRARPDSRIARLVIGPDEPPPPAARSRLRAPPRASLPQRAGSH